MNYDTDEINRLIRNRRSIYPNMYSDAPVDPAVIDQMLENANWAPTHALTQPWRFRVFTGEGLEKLADFQSEVYRKVSTEQGTFDKTKFDKLRQKPLEAQFIIALMMHRDQKHKVPEIEEVMAVACAVQNMYLTATAYGVGCYWTTGGITYMEEAKPFFNLGNEDKLLGFLYIGMPKTKWPEGKRSSVQEKVTWEQ